MRQRPLYLVLALVIACGLLPGPGQAAQVPIWLNGGGVFEKKVQSWKAKRSQCMVSQAFDFSCGAAALATVLQYHFGYPVTERDAIMGMFKYGEQEDIKKRGFSLLDMKRFCQVIKYQAQGYRLPNIEVLKRLPMPLITIIKTQKYHHFVVIRRVDNKYVYTADPSWGNRKIPWGQFEENWPDRVIFAISGPTVGSPKGLYCEVSEGMGFTYDQIIGTSGLVGHNFAMDPTTSVVLGVYRTPLFTVPTVVPFGITY
jgi:predicted double-glycine peptidase